jgi:PTH1 family peptidyl-tRNA hydrolase
LKAIVGLGNPGPDYAGTRHNVGFTVLDALAAGAGWKFRRRAEVASAAGALSGEAVTLVKPLTYMNRSGPAVAALMNDLRLDLSELLVIHDDLDLELGRLRVKAGGGAGGHNGVLSLIEALASDQFARVKIGVGRPPEHMDSADYVLLPPSGADKAALDETVRRAMEAALCWIADGLQTAMNRFNVKPEPQDP